MCYGVSQGCRESDQLKGPSGRTDSRLQQASLLERGVLEDLPAKLPLPFNTFFYLIIALIVHCRLVIVTDSISTMDNRPAR